MYKIEKEEKTHKRIINLLKIIPLSQKGIWEKLDKKISIQTIAKHLHKGINEGSIIYLGNKVSKIDAKLFIRGSFKDKADKPLIWPTNAWQCYIYMPKTEKFYKRLKRRCKNKLFNQEIINLYRIIEFLAMFQKVYYENLSILRRDFNNREYSLTDKELKQKIIRKKKEVKEFYRNRDKKDPFLKLLEFNPLMYWCAFTRPVPVGHPEYDANKDLVLVKDKIYKKLEKAFK